MTEPLRLSPADYDLFTDWEARLAREGPFYRRLFAERGVRRVLDAACGTGRHAAMFSRWGLEVAGSDADPAMIEQAQANAASAGATVRFFTARFADLARHVATPFDAVICVGNSLSMVPDDELEASLAGLASAVKPGGVLVLQVLNALRFAGGGLAFLPLRVRRRGGRTLLLQKIYEPRPREGRLGVHFLLLEERPGGAWRSALESNLLAHRPPAALHAHLEKAGFDDFQDFGGYDGRPFSGDAEDLLVVARRG